MNLLKRKNKMKERIEIRNDSFVDYKGVTHHFTIAAISQELPTNDKELLSFNPNVGYSENDCIAFDVNVYTDCDSGYVGSVTKVVYLGIAVCNPADKFDEKVGKMKAIARARNSKPALYSAELGTINSKLVHALLEQEAEFFKHNPEKFIKGYNESKKTYEKRIAMAKTLNNFNEFELKVMDSLKNDPNCFDRIQEYLKFQENQEKGNVKNC